MMSWKMALQEAATGGVAQPIVRRPAFYAWTASILVHVLLLAGLCFVHFPRDVGRVGERVMPLATVSYIRGVTRSPGVVPKPKVRLSGESARSAAHAAGPLTLTGQNGRDRKNASTLAGNVGFIDQQSFVPAISPDSAGLVSGVAFFGSHSQHRKVCYVVDCSGSMKGLFKRVQERLKQSIGDLQPDQYFHIIFFGDGNLREFATGTLNRASSRNKSLACDFIDSVHPAGKTNALPALERALGIRDVDGNAPGVVYFLTDGFDLDGNGSVLFGRKIAEMVKRSQSAVQINTIGFWPQKDDRNVLEAIASETGGECVLITGDDDAADQGGKS